MRRIGLGGLSLAVLLCGMGAVHADDQPFLTVYTTDIATQYEREIEQSLIWGTQKPHQAFNGILSRTEIEYGIRDDLQVAGYLNYEWSETRPHPAGGNETEHLTSVSGEVIYQVLNPYFDPVGLALYFEPTVGSGVRELEGKILLQKNFFNDNLRLALNINFEDEWVREDAEWEKESAIEFFAGASYNITPELSLGVEFNNENEFEGLIGSGHPEANVYYFGPTVAYVGRPFTVLVGAQFQLPWAHANDTGIVRNGFSGEAERTRVGFQIKMDL